MYCVDGQFFSSWPQVEIYWQAHYPRQSGTMVMHPKCGHQLVSMKGLPCPKAKTCPYTKKVQEIISELFVDRGRRIGCCD